jgi:hypothetical protein
MSKVEGFLDGIYYNVDLELSPLLRYWDKHDLYKWL